MPLTLNCPKCKTPFKVRDEALGQKVKCPTCGAVLAVPANIGPTSMTDVPIDPNARQSSPSYGVAPPPIPARPIQESLRVDPNDDPETLGLEEKPEDLEKHLASPSMKNMGSRGRLESTRKMPEPPPPSGNRPRSPMPAPIPVSRKSQPVRIGEESEQFQGWRSVSRGLRLIQIGTWFTFLPLLCEAGKLAYFHFAKVNPLEGKGFLGIGGTLWQEIALLYNFVPALLGVLLIFFGRVGLTRVPLSSEARGIASGAMLFEFVVFLGVVGYSVYTGLILTRTVVLTEELRDYVLIGVGVTLVFCLLSEVWYLLYLCQLGFPVGEPKMTRRVATFFLFFVLLTAGAVVAPQYVQVFGQGEFTSIEAMQLNIVLSWAGSAFIGFVFLFLYTRLAGKARQAIWRMIEDRER